MYAFILKYVVKFLTNKWVLGGILALSMLTYGYHLKSENTKLSDTVAAQEIVISTLEQEKRKALQISKTEVRVVEQACKEKIDVSRKTNKKLDTLRKEVEKEEKNESTTVETKDVLNSELPSSVVDALRM